MNGKKVLWTIVLPTIVILCCCTGEQNEEQVRPISVSNEGAKTEPVIAELKRLYEAATLEKDRRAICLRAIDQNAIHPGRPVSIIDEVFGTHFASKLPSEKETLRHAFIMFSDQVSIPTRPDGSSAGNSYMGSYIDIDYDSKGTIQNYYLSNLHKGGSRRTDGKEPMSVAELKRLYAGAKSERDRRDVALQAIDEGVIQTFGPVNISTVDAIFDTHLASHLPTKKEVKRTGIIFFAPRKDEAREPSGWFLAVDYGSEGYISKYYLTNVHK